MNTEKAERLREIANRFPTRRLEEKFFLLSLADEESEPSVLHEKQMAKFLSSCVPQLCWKLDRDIWAKVEAKEATTSWGREQSAIAICEAICDNGIGKCMKEQASQDKIWDEVLVLLTDHLFNPRPGNSSITVKMVNEMKSLYHINRRPK